MDPKATIQVLIDALKQREPEAGLSALGALADWMSSGGFSPNWSDVADKCEAECAAIERTTDLIESAESD